MTAYQTLLGKLDEFIRKYYKNRLIKGGILVFAILLASWLSAIFVEHFAHFDTLARTIIFYFWILTALGVTGYYILIPLLKLFKIGEHINYEQASDIIGNHFGEVKDKLLNALQLHREAALHDEQGTLLMASIDQKIKELNPVPFSKAVNFESNYKYIKYAAVPLLVLIGVLVVSPQIVTESSKRIIEHDTFFEKKAPFDFIVSSKKLEAFQNNDFELELKTQGSELPEEVYIELGGKPYRMEKNGNSKFHYTLKNLQKSFDFRFTAGDFSSNGYHFQVLPLPVVLNFEIHINYPAYLNKSPEVLQNTGDVTIPAGSEVSWKFVTSNVEQMELRFGDNSHLNSQRSDDAYTFAKRFTQSTTYSLLPANSHVKNTDSMTYNISVVPDAYPMVDLEEKKDSFNDKVSYFGGDISDDYGLTRLTFNYKYIKSTDESLLKKPATSLPITINPSKTQQAFYHYFNFSEIKINPGDEIEYYFEVWDNDGVNGSKSSRSRTMMLKAPTLEELKELTEQGNKEVKKDLTQAFKEAGKLQKDLKKLQEKLAEKKNLDWQDKKQIEELLKRQKDLEKQLQQVQQETQQNLEMKQEFNQQQNQELLQKQEELQKMMKDVLNDEMKELMKQFEELLKQNDKELMKEKLNEMQVQDKEVQKELDRMLEMFKKIELEQKMEQTLDKLDELSKKQDKLSEESKGKDSKAEDIKKKQEELNKEFKEVQKDLKDIEDKNSEMEKPEEMENTKEEQQQIEQDQKESESELSKNQKQNASKKQKQAAQKMKEMKEKLDKKKQDSEMEQQSEDYDNLRQILENLLQLSFDQEALMEELKTVNGYNPQFVKIGQKQKKLKGDAAIIEDSLLALSKRVQQISKTINKEIGQINANMDNTISLMAERNINMARAKQQYVMTHVNNLAVMLSEVLKQMQDQMNESSSSSSGSKSCKRPGKKKKKGEGKKDGIGSMKELQDQLSKKIEELKKGQKPGQGKPGENGQPQMTKEFAQAAAMQAAIRQRMKQISQQMGKEGATQLKQQLEQIQKLMDQNEKDLYNRRITPETVKRQQEIMTRLLESEKAQMERETDNQRKATEGEDKIKNSQQKTFEEYKKQKNKEAEILRTTPPNFNLYYKSKVKQYFDKQTK